MSESIDKKLQILQEMKAQESALEQDYILKKIRSNLFFDDDAKIDYLASKRFPNDPLASYRYKFQDGQLVYEDVDGKLKPEFVTPFLIVTGKPF